MNFIFIDCIFLGLILCYFLFGLFTKPLNRNNEVFSIIALILCFTQMMIFLSLINEVHVYYYINYCFVSTALILYSKIFVLLCLIIFILISIFYLKDSYMSIFEFYFFIMIATWAMFILISSNDLFVMFLVMELLNLSLYVLISLKRESNLAIEAGFKYLMLNGFSASILGLGLSFIYCFFGTLNITNLILLGGVYDEILCIIGIIFILIGVLFKLAIFPFHYWIADIYEGSDIIVTTFLAIIPKIAAIILFIKLYIVFINFIFNYNFILIIICILSMIYSTIIALYQEKIKRLLAFTAMAHMTFIILCICLNSVEGLIAAIFYLFVYILITINIFSILLSFKFLAKADFGTLLKVVDCVRILKTNGFLAFSFACSLMSMAGIPPFAGFFAKLLVFQALAQTENFAALIFFILMSIISAIYYIRLIRFLFFNNTENITYSLVFSLNNKIINNVIIITLFINIFFYFFFPIMYEGCALLILLDV